ncbi:MAG: dCTP deaminase, partial [Candidatus Aenigmarchaeota archaeon]|nr:dCTP deaminase [Candidatus Aenigmarchaeota archaeon]
MILSDRDIKAQMALGKLKIENMTDPSTQIQPSGIDICLGNEFRVFKSM